MRNLVDFSVAASKQTFRGTQTHISNIVVQFMTGIITKKAREIDEFDKFVEQWLALGGADITEELIEMNAQ